MNSRYLFIVEGPDACGKTTFAKSLADYLRAVYWHMTCTPLLAKAMTDYQLNALENIQANLEAGRDVVMDRLWPSELCYGDHFRADTMIDVEPIRKRTDALQPFYIFCMDPDGPESAASRHEEHLDEAHPYKREDYVAVYENYERLIHSLIEQGHAVAVRDFDPLGVPQEASFIQDILRAYSRHNFHPLTVV